MARPPNPANTLHKICPTCQTPFTCKKRKEKTYCCKKCSTNAPEVKEKNRKGVAEAFAAKYGGHPMAVNAPTKEKFNAKMTELYGKSWFTQTDGFGDKVKAAKLENHGDENYNNIEAMKTTCLEKYGVDNYRKTKEYDEQVQRTCMEKYGVLHSSASVKFKDSHKRLMFEKFLTSSRFSNFIPQFSFDEYEGVTKKFNKKYPFECKRCGHIKEQNIANGNIPYCPKCDHLLSSLQTEVFDFIKSLIGQEVPILVDDRTTIFPLELDMFIPMKNLAIETNGLYWHAEVSGGKNRNYHLNKTKMCAAKGIRLIHIFENEWNYKKDIVKSILRSCIMKTNEIVYARECVVKLVKPNEKSPFLETNHIQGNDHATIKLGLYKDDNLLSIMTFVKSRFDRKIQWEMSRYCTLLNHTVVGGASKLFSAFVEQNHPLSVISYSDRRYFTGELYLKLGFGFINNTPPNYHYIVDHYDTFESRINWQKAKLEKKLVAFDHTLSEWENMKVNGFDRIWDCGHSKWIWIDKSIKSATIVPQ